jgi:hypothetical protein
VAFEDGGTHRGLSRVRQEKKVTIGTDSVTLVGRLRQLKPLARIWLYTKKVLTENQDCFIYESPFWEVAL